MSKVIERNELLLKYQGLVQHCAVKFCRKHPNVRVDEAFSAGQIGLINAAIGFEKSREYKFMTYAHAAIMNELKDEYLGRVRPSLFPGDVEDDTLGRELASPLGSPRFTPVEREYTEREYATWALGLLGDFELAVVWGSYFDDLSLVEIGRKCGVSDETVYRARKRAIEKMRAASREGAVA